MSKPPHPSGHLHFPEFVISSRLSHHRDFNEVTVKHWSLQEGQSQLLSLSSEGKKFSLHGDVFLYMFSHLNKKGEKGESPCPGRILDGCGR